MTNISPTNSPAIAEQYQVPTQAKPTYNKELGQDDFLELMMAQLENQDPMKPMDNGEFLGQMAQFSTVSGIEDMQVSLDKLSSTYATGQTLQTSQLVGQQVLVENSAMELGSSAGTGGSFELDAASGDVMLDIANSAGTVIRQVPIGEFPAGRHTFEWDGLDSNGNRMPPGTYRAVVTAQQGEEFVAASVLTTRIIESVEFGSGGETTLNTSQGDVLTLADIKQIRKSSALDSDVDKSAAGYTQQ